MSEFKEYASFDAIGLAELIKQKKITPRQAADAAVQQIEKYNPQLNAVTEKFYDEIDIQIRQASVDSLFYGVPFLLKDLGASFKGKPLTSSSQLLKDYRPPFDSVLVEKYKKAGFIILGSTNTPELGVMGVTESKFRGPCRNPWSLEHTPGGSSGGSSSAVASHMVPAAHAGDGGGSIRIPASTCGLVGLKPTRGLTPFGPDASDSWLGLVSLHALTRSVRDSAALLDVETEGLQQNSSGKKYFSALKGKKEKLKIAISEISLLGEKLDPQCTETIKKTAETLQDLGHEIKWTNPVIDKTLARKAYMTIVAAAVALEIKKIATIIKRNPRSYEFEETTWFLKQMGDTNSSSELAWALEYSRELERSLHHFFKEHDVFCVSTLGQLPNRIGLFNLTPVEKTVFKTLQVLPQKSLLHAVLTQMSARGFESAPNTQIFNLSGHPAISLPLGAGHDPDFPKSSLPIGAQFVAGYFQEELLLNLAAQLEKTPQWKKCTPQLS